MSDSENRKQPKLELEKLFCNCSGFRKFVYIDTYGRRCLRFFGTAALCLIGLPVILPLSLIEFLILRRTDGPLGTCLLYALIHLGGTIIFPVALMAIYDAPLCCKFCDKDYRRK